MTSSIDYHVELIQFHNGKIREMVVPNDDDSYTIFIESTLSKNEQQQAFFHAISHICNEDFDKKCPVDLIETAAHS